MSSCTTYKNTRLFHTDDSFKFNEFSNKAPEDYKISPDDVMNVRVLANNGDALINVTGQTGENQTLSGGQTGINVSVERDGTAKFPVIGRQLVSGMNKRDLEDFLEKKYEVALYKNPFVTIEISNRSVLVFPGGGGSAKVVQFTKENMTVLDALAMAGGTGKGKTKKIQLIRGDLKNPEVYQINLNTIDGVKAADLTLKSGDIIYVQPYESAASQFSQEVLPYITTISIATSLITTIVLLAITLSP